jgi:hypothetical protein
MQMLKQSNVLSEHELKQKWQHVYQTAHNAGAMVQRDKQCKCFDSAVGRGAAVKIAVWACIGRVWCDVIMKAPGIKDYTVSKIVKGIQLIRK